jgi:acetolactate synthase-1/2/3 large subunit
MQELATLRKYDLKVAVVVFADGYFGNVRRMQEDQFGAAYEVDLRNPAYDRLAAAFDVPYARAESADALARVLSRAVADRTAILIEAPVGEMPSPWGLMRLQARPGAANGGPPNPLGEPAKRG